MKFPKLLLVILLMAFIFPACLNAQEIVHYNAVSERSLDTAILVMTGLGDSRKGRKHQKEFFSSFEYDLYIPDFIERSSYEKGYQNFTEFYEKHELSEYKAVYCFAYIIGGWTLNKFILERDPQNIEAIIYDRSPIQERAPLVATTKIPCITRVLRGRIVEQFSEIPYPALEHADIRIGIMIESRATSLMRMLKKPALALGPINWKAEALGQSFTDFTYLPFNHDEMYLSFKSIGPEIKHFYLKGSFSEQAKREPYDWDFFRKKIEE